MMSTARVLLGFAVVGTSFLSGSFRHVEAQSAEEKPLPLSQIYRSPRSRLSLHPKSPRCSSS